MKKPSSSLKMENKTRVARAAAPGNRKPSWARLFRGKDALYLLALCLAVIVPYVPAMQAGFVWDDRIFLEAGAVRDVSGIWQIWFSPSVIENESHFWPLVYTTFWLEHKLWGFEPLGFHLVNIALHLANTLLVWRLMVRLAVPGAWLIAAVFAVHPLHVESVAWVMERKDLLSTLFYLAAFWTYINFTKTRRSGSYLASLVLFGAGMLCKSIVVTLPAVLLLWHWWSSGRVTCGDLLRLMPFFLVALGIAAADMAFSRIREPISFDYSLVERALIASQALWFYVGKLFWPLDLAIIYRHWKVDAADPAAWLYLAGAAAVPVMLWIYRGRLGRGPLACVVFFAVTLSPILGFIDFGYMQYSFVAERYQYLGGLGIIVLVVAMATRSAGKWKGAGRWATLGLVGLLLVLMGTLTWRQANIYRDVITFNSHILALNPAARFAHVNLAKGLFDLGRLDEALAAAQIAVDKGAVPAEAHTALGATLAVMKRFEEAEHHLRRAVELKPGFMTPLHNLIEMYRRQGRYEDGLEAALIVIGQNPNSFVGQSSSGLMLLQLNRFEEAETYLRRAVELDPRNATNLQNLAEALRKQQRYEEAVEWYGKVIEADPDLVQAYAAMADTFIQIKRYDEAASTLERALGRFTDSIWRASLHNLMGMAEEGRVDYEAAAEQYRLAYRSNSHFEEAVTRLAALHFTREHYEDALKYFRAAAEINPGNPSTWSNIGAVLHRMGRDEEAVASFEHALSVDPDYEQARSFLQQVRRGMR